MKNILINYLGIDGSGPVFSLEMAEGLAKNGNNVYAILSNRIENRIDWINSKYIKKIVFVNIYINKIDYIKHYVKYHNEIKNVVYQNLGNIYFSISIKTFPHSFLDVAEKKLKIKTKVSICHDPLPHKGENFFAKLRNYLYMKKAEKVIVLSRTFIEIVKRKYKIKQENVYYMPHGQMSLYKSKVVKKDLINHKDGYIDFVFFGRIEEYKGIEILAQAYSILKKEYNNISLTIAGKGDFSKYSNYLRNIEDVSIINRYIGDSEVGNLFEPESVVIVVPYIEASQSGVIPIALEYGKCIISTKTGGLWEQLDNGKVGLFVEPGNVIELKDTMSRIVSEQELILRQQHISKDFANSLSWENVTKFIGYL